MRIIKRGFAMFWIYCVLSVLVCVCWGSSRGADLGGGCGDGWDGDGDGGGGGGGGGGEVRGYIYLYEDE
jgi:hypothetical protein